MKLGQYNLLRVVKKTDFGVYLDGVNYGEILLPKRYVPDDCEINGWLRVFIYVDNKDRLIAITEEPLATVGECAALKVVGTTKFGAFFDWGLPKDLLVPRREQIRPMQEGETHVVYIYIDEKTETIVGTTRLELFLDNTDTEDLQPQQAVDLLIYDQSEMGFKAVIDGTHLGLLYANEVYQPVSIGQKLQGYIKTVRDDKKIDLTLQKAGEVVKQELTERIIAHLEEHGGQSAITDKSPPEAIKRLFQVSKGHYKRALGQLYKQRRIVIEPGCIRLPEKA